MQIKRYLCLLFVLIGLSSLLQAARFTMSYVATVGIPFTLDPAIDIGTTHEKITWMSGMMNENSSYSYVPTLFSYTTTTYVGASTGYGGNGAGQYYVITPLKTGTATFIINMSGSINGTNFQNWESAYTITIVDVTKIALDFESLTLSIGQSQAITPTITHQEAETTLKWASNNTSVATVTQDGKVTAKGVGTATITCTAHNGVSAQCQVTVNPIMVESITLNETNCQLTIGDALQLSASVLPTKATNKSVTWSSTNELVAVVDEAGRVTALSSGSCQIKATANDGSGKTASCLVSVLGDVMFCEDFAAVPTARIVLPIRMTNEDAIQGFEFKLVLPDGVSVVSKDGALTASLTSRTNSDGLECVQLSNNTYHFVYTSANRISGSSGIVVKVLLAVNANMPAGTYDVLIKDVELVDYSNSSIIHPSDQTAKLTINELILGDVNGDNRISVADAISIINYVLGRTPVSFITKAADANNDGSISLADAVAVVDIILGRNTGSGVKAVTEVMLDPQ